MFDWIVGSLTNNPTIQSRDFNNIDIICLANVFLNTLSLTFFNIILLS